MRSTVLSCALALTACGTGGDYYYVPVGGSPPPPTRTVAISTDATLEPSKLGEEVGLFVEYSAGGGWHLFTSCDTLAFCPKEERPKCNFVPCSWDVVATAVTGKLDATSAELDSDDEVDRVDDGSVRLVLTTGDEMDSVRLSADPGEKLTLDVFLDGNYDPTYVYWVRDDGTASTNGAPSDPVVFSPTLP